MDDTEKDALEESLQGYKEKVSPIDKATLTWDRDLIFVGRTGQGYEIEFDARVQWGCKPTDALLLSLAGCMGIDMVSFLKKMRAEIAGFRISMTGERNPAPPQYYKTIEMTLHIAGKNLDPKKVERAVSLSHEKYCSVYNSLRKDIEVKVRYVLEEKEPDAEDPGGPAEKRP
ncbi:MAG: OsmC family protein [Thermodesulfovibrionales bacterium]